MIEPSMSALEARKLSERENRIVHLRYSDQLHADLFADCDDHVENGKEWEYWAEAWRVHLHKGGAMSHVQTITSIHIASPNDAGCEISADEHTRYCELVADEVKRVYGVPCEVELRDIDRTRVTVYGRSEPGTDESIRGLAQDVWERGDFWERP